jgi:hypothetical protein
LLEYFEDNRVELFNLHEDMAEKLDLSTRLPDRVGEMVKKLHAWRESVSANLPKVNPKFGLKK